MENYTYKTCKTCSVEKSIDSFQKDKRRPDGHTSFCLRCAAIRANEWHHKNRDHHNRKMNIWWHKRKKTHPEKHLWEIAKRRAKEDGRPFSITPTDLVVPKNCPVLGVDMAFGAGSYSPNSPSVDAIIPKLGYVPGNVAVISHRANSIKQNATPEELRKVANWLEKMLQSAASDRN